HAYMLRIAIPYGQLSSAQMRLLADIAEQYDQGYGHFTTRQNIQFNWIRLVDTPAILQTLAAHQMHAIQTSGNCIRNITSDPFAGAAADEIVDPRPIAEWLRQWSTLHPEFAFLPRKFKFAISGSATDRAAVAVHDIGLKARLQNDEIGVEIWVGGGQGRTPKLAKLLYPFVPLEALIPRLEAILRVYNEAGRRDNKYKARIKILLEALGKDQFKALVAEAEALQPPLDATAMLAYREIAVQFVAKLPPASSQQSFDGADDPAFQTWCRTNLTPHKDPNRSIVSVSLKPAGGIPGDATAVQMRVLADLAERYSASDIRITHRQNVVLPHVAKADLYALYSTLKQFELHTANIGLASDIIACPGLDYCALATARSIPIAQALSQSLLARSDAHDLGELAINISGCINACGHHHVATIGILGLNKGGEEYYQLTLGGSAFDDAAIGERAGRGLSDQEVIDGVHRLLDVFADLRAPNETLLQATRRLGTAPFVEAIYAQD
ncbi:MAG: nitrite/sulfite reductase, partial [Gammaproteobacteria bacterium]|nr:nitrite/sulfite reductase [Gammaproteobacteria bacterium]